MPTILKYFGFTFFFYSHDHFPVHVHVDHGEFESIFELIFAEGKLIEIKHRKSAGIEQGPFDKRYSRCAVSRRAKCHQGRRRTAYRRYAES